MKKVAPFLLMLGRIFGDFRFREPHRVVGPLDARLDRNRDGHVGGEELHEFYQRVTRVAALARIETPEQREDPHPVRSEFDRRIDFNGNGNGFVEPPGPLARRPASKITI